MQTIGMIGLGVMGKPIALNLLQAKYPVAIYARREDVKTDLIKAGAKHYASPNELALHCDVIITLLPSTHTVEEILLGRRGVILGAKAGTIVIDMSTISANITQKIGKKLAERKIEMLDAPLAGDENSARSGTLTIMVGGLATTIKKVQPLFNSIGKKIIHVGPLGAGQIAKMCNQMVIAQSLIALDEALRLAKISGVDPAKVRETLLGDTTKSTLLDIHGKRMLDENYKPGFKAGYHRENMHLALEQAHLVNLDLPAAKYATQCLDRLVMKGHSDLDSSAIHILAEE